MFKLKKSPQINRSKAYAHLPDGMFADWVTGHERWCVELMYLVRDAVKDQIPAKAKPYFSDTAMAEIAYEFVASEASIAMDNFLTNLAQADVKIPASLLDPLLAVARHIVDYGITEERFEATCQQLRANARVDDGISQ